MELKWFEDFLSVARSLNFTRAADERHITQSALSRRIRQLEEWLGVPLFDRKTWPITLTPEGQTFLATAHDTVFSMNQLRNDLHQRFHSRTAVLRFAMLNTLSLTFFPDWIQRLNLHQQLGYIRMCNSKPSFMEHIATLHSGESDFLLTYAHDAVSLIHQLDPYPMLQLGREWAIPVCRPDSSGQPLYPIDNKGKPIPWLSYGSHSFFAHALAQMLSEHPLPLEPVYENGMSVNLKAMVLAGGGVAWLPLSLVHEELSSGALVRAGSDDWEIKLAIRLYRQPVLRNPEAEQLWQRIQQCETAHAA
ncbi:DNA-binding transcriptional LysR family regulator [Enterobacter sp. BIGb0383]|uniref:LysR family transcriptional regulator n=1 Tax=unclassified Enterobacter TaxID=2608935 RepID=UPI000F47DDF2|nr:MULTISPECIES: LysR family transcriptional regulator [unclassified Enterobacter]ROP62758.1 DNA-binding transcriptional LysR family regulator [Enterobacter sp. BIGb0383]ROS12919.1 DNA-binding transcriptional LysR family regulator [Enterobacter sp. BIGb0359]